MNQANSVKLLDYKQESASRAIVPQLARIGGWGWNQIHVELHQQPKLETIEHQHNMHIIAFGLAQSSGERWLDGKCNTERRFPGDVAIIPAGISHRCNWNEVGEFGILAIEPILLLQTAQDLIKGDRFELIPQYMNQGDELLTGIFAALKYELESQQMGSGLLIDSLKTTLAIHLVRRYGSIKPQLSNCEIRLSRKQFKQVTEYINEYLDRNLKVIELAAIAQVSPYHFIRMFKNTTGKTPHQYILQQRVETARYLLLKKEISISAIANQMGFCDQSHLNKYFKRIVGMTPRKFLKLHRDRVVETDSEQ